PDRRKLPCRHVDRGCGGCDWQHVAVDAQRHLRAELVAEVLGRAGGVADPRVELGRAIPAEGVRTIVRGTALDGRFAFRRRRSHEAIDIDRCLVAHPLVDEVIAEGRFANADEVVIRAGAGTGERLVIVGPTAEGVEVPPGITVVGRDELKAGRRAWFHEEVAGRSWRVSADSFFQASADGAEALVEGVRSMVDEVAPDAERMVDLCCGVGLFAGTVGRGRSVIGVERSNDAVVDARHNLGAAARIVRSALERWGPSAADVVVADPARKGLAKAGVAAVVATGAAGIVLVSCDLGALGRDTGLLQAAGYRHHGSTVLDLFGHTSHVEVISGFVRAAP
ncbi:MAG TPA: hypothetical protein VGM93_00695, partial [Acidimicrobiales bacterium]